MPGILQYMQLGIIAIVFGVIFISELPDKSLFAALVLGTKFRALYVWLGAALAFLVHVIIAVTAGRLLTLLPHKVVAIIVSLLFLGGALLLFFGKHGLEDDDYGAVKKTHSFLKAFGTSFGVVFLGEWGDITQIVTANYTAHYHDTVNVAIGAVLALWAVTGLAILAGNKLLRRVPGKLLQRVTGTILLIFALISAWQAFH